MNNEIDTEKIKPCETCRMRETCGAKGELCNDYSKDETLPTYQTTSVLPKQPCEKCGGSEKVWPADEFGLREEGTDKIPCPACGAPVGKIEGFVAKGRHWHLSPRYKPVKEWIDQACTHLEAQAKQIAGFEASLHRAEEMLNEYRKRIIEYEETEAQVCPEDVGIKEYVAVLQTKIAQLEDGAFAANEEAQIRNDQIKQKEKPDGVL